MVGSGQSQIRMSDSKTQRVCSAKGCGNELPPPLLTDAELQLQRHTLNYRPLNPHLQETRLIRILPGSRDSPIKCKLFYAPLFRSQLSNVRFSEVTGDFDPRQPNYIWRALSHVWGDADDQIPIYINDREVDVRSNLHDCLIWLRLHKYAGPLWIDALCINQADGQERATQVSMMSQIYSFAAETIIYTTSDPTLTYADNTRLNEALKRTVWSDNTQLMTQIIDWANGEEDKTMDAICKIAESPYWTRLWTIQEYALAQDLKVVSGGLILDVQQLSALRDAAVQSIGLRLAYGQIDLSNDKTFALLGGSFELRQNLRNNKESVKLLDLPSIMNRSYCTDLRDMIFGVAGLVKDHFTVDYTLCQYCVWRDAAISIITNTDRLDLLSSCGYYQHDDVEYASWLPVWNAMNTLLLVVSDYQFSPLDNSTWKISSDKRELIASGFVLGSVTGHFMCTSQMGNASAIAERLTLLYGDTLAQMRHRFLNFETDEACVRALTNLSSDCVEDGSQHREDFQAFFTTCLRAMSLADFEDTTITADVPQGLRKGLTLLEKATILTSESSTGVSLLALSRTTDIEDGDVLVGVPGCRLPLVVRRTERGDKIVGPCVIGGYGQGEAMAEWKAGKWASESFRFI